MGLQQQYISLYLALSFFIKCYFLVLLLTENTYKYYLI